MRRVQLVIAAGIVSAAVFAGMAPSAQAHNICAFNPPDPSAGCWLDHSRFRVCDQQVDGHLVRVRFTVYGGSGYFYTPWDSTDAGCALERTINHVREMWLCIETEGCGLGVRHN
jgi:hypothetical protein